MHYCQKYNYYKFILNNVVKLYVYITFPSFKHMQINLLRPKLFHKMHF